MDKFAEKSSRPLSGMKALTQDKDTGQYVSCINTVPVPSRG